LFGLPTTAPAGTLTSLEDLLGTDATELVERMRAART